MNSYLRYVCEVANFITFFGTVAPRFTAQNILSKNKNFLNETRSRKLKIILKIKILRGKVWQVRVKKIYCKGKISASPKNAAIPSSKEWCLWIRYFFFHPSPPRLQKRINKWIRVSIRKNIYLKCWLAKEIPCSLKLWCICLDLKLHIYTKHFKLQLFFTKNSFFLPISFFGYVFTVLLFGQEFYHLKVIGI